MIEKMTKYSFILLKGKDEDFLTAVQELGVVDITRSSKPVDKESADLMNLTKELGAAIKALTSLDWSEDPDKEKIASEKVEIDTSDILGCYRQAVGGIKALEEELAAARKEAASSRAWGKYDPEAFRGLEDLGFRIRFYCVPKKKFDSSWEQLYPLQVVSDNGKEVRFVTVSDDAAYSLPAAECQAPAMSPDEAESRIGAICSQIVRHKAELSALKEYAGTLSEQYGEKAGVLQRHLACAGAGSAAEGMVTTFTGFAPTEKDGELSKALDGMDVVYIKDDAVKEDNPPIKFKGNKFTRMFSVLTDMYGRPSYDEFDPTPYISVFFTLFFAMCMGDAGYGLILLIAGLGLKKMLGSMAPLVTVLGGATFVMGIVLHTFFGMDISAVSWVPDWLKACMITGTIAGYDAQMLFSILIGVVHLSIAMILKAVYACRKNGFLNSLGTLGWTLLLVGGVAVGAFFLLGVIDGALTKWIIIVLGGISALGIFLLNDIHRNPLINIGSGLYETYNTVTGLLGDVLSYLRLYALGLAGGMLGSAFNSLGTSLLDIGIPGVNFIACGLILIFGHVLNLAMCCLGAFVHPLRLNFLEFFKNSGYEGEGRVYRPLSKSGEIE
ncbi:MAG: V-type ATP synthase subunit I [Candidatus Cryptobacteroides sp.]